MADWIIGIRDQEYRVGGNVNREEAIRIAWLRHNDAVGVIITTKREGETEDDMIPWRSVDVAYRILGDYELAKKFDAAMVEIGLPSVLPPLI